MLQAGFTSARQKGISTPYGARHTTSPCRHHMFDRFRLSTLIPTCMFGRVGYAKVMFLNLISPVVRPLLAPSSDRGSILRGSSAPAGVRPPWTRCYLELGHEHPPVAEARRRHVSIFFRTRARRNSFSIGRDGGNQFRGKDILLRCPCPMYFWVDAAKSAPNDLACPSATMPATHVPLSPFERASSDESICRNGSNPI